MASSRKLFVIADDYGIGPATSRGILRLCRANVVSGTVLLVNSPFAKDAVRLWKQSNPLADLGWHPCLTLDAPILDPAKVPSLVQADGKFLPLGLLMCRLFSGRVRPSEVRAEFRAQFQVFCEMVGYDPVVVNAHHHVQVFPIIGAALREVLSDCRTRPYLRCVREPFSTMKRVLGARCKRAFLSMFGRREARIQLANGFVGSDWLAGITDPAFVHSPSFFCDWLSYTPGKSVELTCHPGEYDATLLGRDAQPGDGNLERRTQELHLLLEPSFRSALAENNFQICRPSELVTAPNEMRRAA